MRLILHVGTTKYPVIREVGKNIFNFKLTGNDEEDWDLQWTDNAVPTEKLFRMKPY